MYLIALTGGIGSGKSFVSNHLAGLGAVRVDADSIAREIVAPGTPAFRAILDHFGPRILSGDGAIDRRALASIVFADPGELAVLNAISHPLVRSRSAQLFDAANRADPNAIVVYEVPLLVETSGSRPDGTDIVVVVHASAATRLDRLVTLRGMDPDEARSRIRSQASDDQRRAIADWVIDNDDGQEATLRQTEQLWLASLANARSKRSG